MQMVCSFHYSLSTDIIEGMIYYFWPTGNAECMEISLFFWLTGNKEGME